jgi:hypothetical protein
VQNVAATKLCFGVSQLIEKKANEGRTMKWIVEGANPETGRELRREVDAPSAEVALEIANSRGMVVSDVKPATEIKFSDDDVCPKWTGPDIPVPSLPHPAHKVSTFIFVLAVLCYVSAVVSILSMVLAVAARDNSAIVVNGFVAASSLGVSVIAGAALHGLACIVDMLAELLDKKA